MAEPANPLAGLQALPTPNQVLAAVAIGRRDPFGAISSGAATSGVVASGVVASGAVASGAVAPAAKPGLPAGFSFTGVLRSGGQVQALVQFGKLSGTLSIGQQGGRSTDLLPPGWRVERVDGQLGRLVLRSGSQNGGQPVVAEL